MLCLMQDCLEFEGNLGYIARLLKGGGGRERKLNLSKYHTCPATWNPVSHRLCLYLDSCFLHCSNTGHPKASTTRFQF